jgi:2-dehydro-3-deoxyphosphogluconate aldolase/(4S)-4-hydroxy-2-oxoglutarate aldolase
MTASHQSAELVGIAQLLHELPVVPIVAIDDVQLAPRIAAALLDGGVTGLEIPVSGSNAFAAIRAIRAQVPHARVGAGMIYEPAQVRLAVDAGASFITSPGSSPAIFQAARSAGIDLLPGVSTLSEAMSALAAGYDLQRFFPADLYGGPAWLRGAAVVLPAVRFSAAGGINLRNAGQYLELSNVASVTGTWLVPPSFIASGNWRGITELAAEARALKSGGQ